MKKIFYFINLLLQSNKFKDLPHSDYLLIIRDSDRSFLLGKKFYSVLLNTLEDDLLKLNLKGVTIAPAFSKIRKKDVYGETYFFDLQYFIVKVIDKILFINYFKFEYWKRILLYTQPRYIIAIQPDIILCTVCSNLGIKIFDYQHGIIADDYYYNINYWSNHEKTLPISFLVWDQESEKMLRSIFYNYNLNIRILGNSWVYRCINYNKFPSLFNEFIDNFNNLNFYKKPVILITLQKGAGIKNINQILNKSLLNVIKNTYNLYFWAIRIHPSQNNVNDLNEIENILTYEFPNSNNFLDYKISSSMPLPLLLQFTNLHITYNSASAIEALKFGINTGFIDKNKYNIKEWFKFYWESNFLNFLPETDQDLFDWIKKNICNNNQSSSINNYNPKNIGIIF
jgi:hypothetical protein